MLDAQLPSTTHQICSLASFADQAQTHLRPIVGTPGIRPAKQGEYIQQGRQVLLTFQAAKEPDRYGSTWIRSGVLGGWRRKVGQHLYHSVIA
jgi:hypothetical protein